MMLSLEHPPKSQHGPLSRKSHGKSTFQRSGDTTAKTDGEEFWAFSGSGPSKSPPSPPTKWRRPKPTPIPSPGTQNRLLLLHAGSSWWPCVCVIGALKRGLAPLEHEHAVRKPSQPTQRERWEWTGIPPALLRAITRGWHRFGLD